jgi:hypothetical protein
MNENIHRQEDTLVKGSAVFTGRTNKIQIQAVLRTSKRQCPFNFKTSIADGTRDIHISLILVNGKRWLETKRANGRQSIWNTDEHICVK